jgi:hypothetical protein
VPARRAPGEARRYPPAHPPARSHRPARLSHPVRLVHRIRRRRRLQRRRRRIGRHSHHFNARELRRRPRRGPERSFQQMPPCIEKATADAVAAGHRDWRSPGSRLSAAISRFYSTDHRRRLSPRVITSIRWPRTLIRSVVRASFPSAIGSAASSSITMDNTHHTITASRNGGSTLRLLRLRTASVNAD